MAYTRTLWEARQGVNLNRFSKSQETENSVILTNAPDSITRQGTPFSTDNMNNIETGIVSAHNLITAETLARQQGDRGLQEQIDAIKQLDIQDSIAAELRASIAAESQARQQADQALQASIVETQQDTTIALIALGLFTVHVRPNGELVLRTAASGNHFGLRVDHNGNLIAQMTDGRPNYFSLNADTGELIFSI